MFEMKYIFIRLFNKNKNMAAATEAECPAVLSAVPKSFF